MYTMSVVFPYFELAVWEYPLKLGLVLCDNMTIIAKCETHFHCGINNGQQVTNLTSESRSFASFEMPAIVNQLIRSERWDFIL